MGVIIYGLVDPLTKQLRYIGKTSGTSHKRRLQHLSDVRRGRVYIPRHKWIAGLLAAGVEPEIFDIETVAGDWQDAERFWISYFRSIGCNLLNATDGGDGLCSFRHRPETRTRQSEAGKARYAREGERERTGAAVKRGQNNPGFLPKLMAAKANISAETRTKLSSAAKIHRNTPEAKAAQSARTKGRRMSKETKRRLSDAKRGRKRSAESIARQVASITGRKRGPYKKRQVAL